MKFKTSTLVFLGIVLACIGFRFQDKNPALASFSALTGALLMLVAAGRLREEKKRLKAAKRNNMASSKNKK